MTRLCGISGFSSSTWNEPSSPARVLPMEICCMPVSWDEAITETSAPGTGRPSASTTRPSTWAAGTRATSIVSWLPTWIEQWLYVSAKIAISWTPSPVQPCRA